MFVAFFFHLKFDFHNFKLYEKKLVSNIVIYILYTYSFNLAFIEFKQWLTQGHDTYFMNGWNIVDLIGCSLLSFGITLKVLCEFYFLPLFDEEIIEIFYIGARYSYLPNIY